MVAAICDPFLVLVELAQMPGETRKEPLLLLSGPTLPKPKGSSKASASVSGGPRFVAREPCEFVFLVLFLGPAIGAL